MFEALLINTVALARWEEPPEGFSAVLTACPPFQKPLKRLRFTRPVFHRAKAAVLMRKLADLNAFVLGTGRNLELRPLCRGVFPTGRPIGLASFKRIVNDCALPSATRRYSRVPLCATKTGAPERGKFANLGIYGRFRES